MTTGTITRLVDRGYGFIAPASGSDQDLFFHSTAVADNAFEHLQEGQQVTFVQEADPRDPSRQRATNVSAVESTER